MALAPQKRVQSLARILTDHHTAIEQHLAAIEAAFVIYDANPPDLTGTGVSAANITTIKNAVTALRTEVDRAVWDAIKIKADSAPTHDGNAL